MENYKIHTNKEDLENLQLKGVYLIRNLNNTMLKIGIADNLKKRFKNLIGTFKHCGENPNLKIECFIEYEHNYELEQWLHKEFNNYNYQNEWFDIKDINTILDKINEFKYVTPTKIIKTKKSIDKNKKEKTLNKIEVVDKLGFYHSLNNGYFFTKINKDKDIMYEISCYGNNLLDSFEKMYKIKSELLNIKKQWSDGMSMYMEYENNEGYISNESIQQELYKLKEKFNSDVIIEITLVDYKNDTHRFLGFTSYENYCNHIKRKAIKKEIRKKQVEIEKLIEELSYI